MLFQQEGERRAPLLYLSVFLISDNRLLPLSKDGKKYAAMWAMRCIDDLISRPRQSTPKPPTPHQYTPRHLPPKVQDPENTNGVPLNRSNGGPSAPSDRAAPPSVRNKEKLDDAPDALIQVPNLCKVLGMMPPQFVATPVCV